MMKMSQSQLIREFVNSCELPKGVRNKAWGCSLFTIDPKVPEAMEFLANVRKFVSMIGKGQLRIKAQGRLGKNNPNAAIYRNKQCIGNPYQIIHLKNAAEWDCYLYDQS